MDDYRASAMIGGRWPLYIRESSAQPTRQNRNKFQKRCTHDTRQNRNISKELAPVAVQQLLQVGVAYDAGQEMAVGFLLLDGDNVALGSTRNIYEGSALAAHR